MEQQNNKYYTPTIEEFCVGFECELRNSSGKNYEWEPFKIVGVDDGEISGSKMDWSFYDSANAIKDEMIRVKYLDMQDIEECGWDTIGSAWYNLKEVPGKLGYFLYVRMRFFNNEALIKAYRYDPKDTPSDIQEEATLFDGVIKNKSELKRLMKQLGIHE